MVPDENDTWGSSASFLSYSGQVQLVPKTYLTSCSCFLLKFFHDKATQEVREASGSGDGDVVVPLAESEDNGMPGVDKEKAVFAGNLL